ncbi:hypothetical protein I3V23_09125 [Rhodobacterales bacterium HKCCA1288]|nr:hypothetical protein I3V23_09125 [Rhodobacterales bacterium HKCCA1288]
MIINARTSETSDLYMGVVARPLTNLRIAVCRNAIQWLVQVRDGEKHGAARWKTCAYVTTRPGLIKALRRFGGLSERDADEVVDALPSRQTVTKTGSSK